MKIDTREQFALQFANCMARLRALGLQAEITVQAGVVMVATHDKANAAHFRKAIRAACRKTGAVMVENRPNATARIFTVVVDSPCAWGQS